MHSLSAIEPTRHCVLVWQQLPGLGGPSPHPPKLHTLPAPPTLRVMQLPKSSLQRHTLPPVKLMKQHTGAMVVVVVVDAGVVVVVGGPCWHVPSGMQIVFGMICPPDWEQRSGTSELVTAQPWPADSWQQSPGLVDAEQLPLLSQTLPGGPGE